MEKAAETERGVYYASGYCFPFLFFSFFEPQGWNGGNELHIRYLLNSTQSE